MDHHEGRQLLFDEAIDSFEAPVYSFSQLWKDNVAAAAAAPPTLAIPARRCHVNYAVHLVIWREKEKKGENVFS